MTENQQPEEVEEIELTDRQRFEMGVSAHGDPTGLIARYLTSTALLDRLYKSEAHLSNLAIKALLKNRERNTNE